MIASGYGISFADDRNILELVVMVAQLCTHTKKSHAEHFKRVNSMVCEIYFSKAVI